MGGSGKVMQGKDKVVWSVDGTCADVQMQGADLVVALGRSEQQDSLPCI